MELRNLTTLTVNRKLPSHELTARKRRIQDAKPRAAADLQPRPQPVDGTKAVQRQPGGQAESA